MAAAFGYGSGRSRTPYTMLNIAVFAPRPNASMSATLAAKPGLRLRPRTAWRRSRPRSLRPSRTPRSYWMGSRTGSPSGSVVVMGHKADCQGRSGFAMQCRAYSPRNEGSKLKASESNSTSATFGERDVGAQPERVEHERSDRSHPHHRRNRQDVERGRRDRRHDADRQHPVPRADADLVRSQRPQAASGRRYRPVGSPGGGGISSGANRGSSSSRIAR